MIYISHELKAIYIHMPKCGGCYIRDILIKYYGFQNICRKSTRKDYATFFDNPEQVTTQDDGVDSIRKFGVLRYYLDNPNLDKQRIDAFKYYYIFTFVRNPYEKIVSGFLYIKKFVCWRKTEAKAEVFRGNSVDVVEGVSSETSNKKEITNIEEEEEEEDDYMDEFAEEEEEEDEEKYMNPEDKNITYEEMKNMKAPTGGYFEKIKDNSEYYSDFITYIKNRKNICNVSYFHSFVTQTQHLINYDNKLNIHYIATIENLDNDLINILSHLGITDFKHMDYIYKNVKINVSENKKKIMDYYDEDTFNIVNELMNEDFTAFNYKKFETYNDFINGFIQNKEEIDIQNKTSLTNIYKEFKILNSNNDKLQKIDDELSRYFSNVFTNLELMLRITETNYFFHDTKKDILKLLEEKREIMVVSKKIESGTDLEIKMMNGNGLMKKDENTNICDKCGFVTFNKYAMDCHKLVE